MIFKKYVIKRNANLNQIDNLYNDCNNVFYYYICFFPNC
ncbi:hypothetical protein VCRA2110O182_40126 [Vibrio crassostreae]|nr:hypothetical protein VCRA2110O182_40126 [Vibrio crassostreae]